MYLCFIPLFQDSFRHAVCDKGHSGSIASPVNDVYLFSYTLQDASLEIVASFKTNLEVRNIRVICTGHSDESPRGRECCACKQCKHV